jgi:hypothetical protein
MKLVADEAAVLDKQSFAHVDWGRHPEFGERRYHKTIDQHRTAHAAPVRLRSVDTKVDSRRLAQPRTKKADVAEHPKAFDHVGLLFNEPPGKTGLFFI